MRTVRFAEPVAGVRAFGPNATFAQDMEPEYVAVAPSSKTAWVTLQENNAVAEIDLVAARVNWIRPLGGQDRRRRRNSFDPSDDDGRVGLRRAPVLGLFQPDAIAAFRAADDRRYLVTADEGDARDYECFGEEERVGDLELDPTRFPDAATLQLDENLGRLKVTSTGADADGDGKVDTLHAFGGRSFSIWNDRGGLVWSSGGEIERLLARLQPAVFNSDHEENDSFDARSDDKGPEPEALALGRVGDRQLAFVGLERDSGIVVYDISDPRAPRFESYVTTRDFAGDPETGTAGDLGPEGLVFIPCRQSPNRRDLLVAAYEISGSVRIFEVKSN